MSRYRALAPAKVNLGLFLGPIRAQDAKHELVTVMQSISLADELELELAPAGVDRDEVLCPGLAEPPEANLAAVALAAFRERAGWDGPPVRVRIDKRIPIAAGLAGGSADAAATLRLARHASGLGDEQLLHTLAAELGADVPAQVSPGRWLAGGAGEHLQELPDPNPESFGLLIVPSAAGLSTAAVFEEADRLGLGRSGDQLEDRRRALQAALELSASVPAASELLENDLQRAALSLCPDIARTLREVHEAGADFELVSGSGPTVVGLFPHANGLGRAQRAAAAMQGRLPAPICATPVNAAFARVVAHAGD